MPCSSSSRAGEFVPLLARVMFVAVALVFASATRSVSAKVYFSETFDGTGKCFCFCEYKKSKRVSILFFLLSSFFSSLLGGRAHPMKARVFSSFYFADVFSSNSYFH